jgi:hypothetical protein
MKKKITLFLIIVMAVNMIVWAEEEATEEEVDPLIYLAAVGIVVLVVLVVAIPLSLLSEADAPDDGIKLTSMRNVDSTPRTGFGPVMNILQHIEVGQTQNDKMYVGLRFRF